MLKKAVRGDYMKKRLQLTDEVWRENSMRILNNFKLLRIPHCNYLMSYYPLVERKEFDVSVCDDIVKGKSPGVKIAWPRIESDMTTMEFYQIQPDGLYAKNKFNILEPINGEWVPPELIDLCFVPLVAFDKKGYRIGYGKGFYDRYLHRCKPSVLKIGFSFFEPIDQIKDIHEFDVPLNLCITPSGIYEF